jgi:hypothetical protein
MAVLSGCATVWAGARWLHWYGDLLTSDWWAITVTVTAAMLIGKALSWLQTLLGLG